YDFLAGPLFQGVIASFGRPAAFDRPVLEFAIADSAITPAVASIETRAIATGQSIPATLQAEAQAHRQALARPGLFATATMLDSTNWTVSRFALVRRRADAPHVSEGTQLLTVLAVVGSRVGNTVRHAIATHPACAA